MHHHNFAKLIELISPKDGKYGKSFQLGSDHCGRKALCASPQFSVGGAINANGTRTVDYRRSGYSLHFEFMDKSNVLVRTLQWGWNPFLCGLLWRWRTFN